MEHPALLVGIVAACLVAGCSSGKEADDHAAAEQLARICPIYLRHENSDRVLDPSPFIRPEHVAYVSLAKPYYEGEKAIWVQLTAAGSERMYKETKNAVGSRIAFFCGSKELERATLQAPIKGGFRVTLPNKGGT